MGKSHMQGVVKPYMNQNIQSWDVRVRYSIIISTDIREYMREKVVLFWV
jgi:hypothetical protein